MSLADMSLAGALNGIASLFGYNSYDSLPAQQNYYSNGQVQSGWKIPVDRLSGAYTYTSDPTKAASALGLASNSLVDGNDILGSINLGDLATLGSGLMDLYGMWNQFSMANDALDLARDQFNFSKNFSSAQLNNQIDSYNTALADRARTRAYTETGNANAYNDWYDKNKLNSFKG